MSDLKKNYLVGEFKHFFDAQPTIFEKIWKIIEANPYRISTYEIMAYSHLQMRLIIRYHDCFDVYDFQMDNETKTVYYTTFYTEDFTDKEQTENSKDWTKRYERDKPEIKKAP